MFSMNRRPAAVIPLLLASALGLAACTNASAEVTADTGGQQAGQTAAEGAVAVNEEARALLPESVRSSGTLVFASDPTYPPFEYMDTDNKTLIGFDIDLTDLVAQSLGLKAKHTAATFDTILPGLTSGKYDVGVSSFSITADRKKAVDFVPYMAGGTAIGVATGNPKNLSLTDKSLCGQRIAAQKGSIQALTQGPKFSKDCATAGEPAIDIQTFPGQSDANLALISGRVDAILSDSVSLAFQGEKSGGKFEVADDEDYQRAGVGLAVKKNSQLTAALDKAMEDLLDTEAYGKVYADWKVPTRTQIDAADFAKYSK